MKRRGLQHHLDGLIALLLFGIFAVCVLAVLLTGANAYRRLTQRDQANFDRRVCVQYLATRVRQADAAREQGSALVSGVSVEPFGDGDALVLAEDEAYVTRIYCHEGHLMELYAEKNGDFQPADGTPVMAAGGLGVSLEDGLLTLEIISPEGAQDTLRLALRSGEEAAA